MNFNAYFIIFITSVFLLVTGCTSSSHIYTDHIEGVDFSKYQTYAWLPHEKAEEDVTSYYDNSIVWENIHQKVNCEMLQRGLAIDTVNPDLLIYVHLDFSEKEKTIKEPIYDNYSYYHSGFSAGVWYPFYYPHYHTVRHIDGYEIKKVSYTQRQMVIDIIEPRKNKNKLIWRGWSKDKIQPKTHDYTFRQDINALFDEFPRKERRICKGC